MNNFSNFKKSPNESSYQKNLTNVFERKVENILKKLQIEIFDHNEDWEGTANITGIKEAIEEISLVLSKEISTNSRKLLENCLENLYKGNVKQIQKDIESLNENSVEPDYWEAGELEINYDTVKSIFKESSLSLIDIDFMENKIVAYIDCEQSGLKYNTIDALEITVGKLRSLENKAEALGFFLTINPEPFNYGKLCINLQQ